MRREAKNERYARTERRKERGGGEGEHEVGEKDERRGGHVSETRWREKKREEDEEKSE